MYCSLYLKQSYFLVRKVFCAAVVLLLGIKYVNWELVTILVSISKALFTLTAFWWNGSFQQQSARKRYLPLQRGSRWKWLKHGKKLCLNTPGNARTDLLRQRMFLTIFKIFFCRAHFKIWRLEGEAWLTMAKQPAESGEACRRLHVQRLTGRCDQRPAIDR